MKLPFGWTGCLLSCAILGLGLLAGNVESAGAGDARGGAAAHRMMVAAADPRAVEAGLEILRAGGGAVDAAVAVQTVLNLVEPQSSGIGGGGFMLFYDAEADEVVSYDGRETAPAAAGPDLFLKPEGTPMPFREAMVGGRAVGVPGALRMLELAHREHGRLPWAELFAPAIELAEKGFEIPPRLARMIAEGYALDRYEATASYFLASDGTPKAAGTVLVNRPFAQTLREVAQGGADAFYLGEIARDIVAAVRGTAGNPGLMTEADLASYRAKRRAPVCATYRAWRVCGMGPPSSGGLTTLQILGMLENFDLSALAPNSLGAVHLIAEASRLAFADRARYMADADYVRIPVEGLLNKAYLAARAARISLERSMPRAPAGQPPGIGGHWLEPHAASWLSVSRPGPQASSRLEAPSTTHFSIIDAEGNAVAMTSSIEQAFGSRLMVRGFLLNQQLTDFAFVPEVGGVPAANRVEPGKRPRSSMSPTLVFDREGELVMALGSPGGPRIIGYVTQALIGVLDWDLGMQAAVSLPHFVDWSGAIELEKGTPLETLAPELEAMGHRVEMSELDSGLHGILVTPTGLLGGADPRREGRAHGE